MAKKRRILVVTLLVAVLCGIAWLVLPVREPVYQGKKLSAWLVELDTGNWPTYDVVPANTAIRHMGTNTFPMIDKMLHVRDYRIKQQLIELLNKQSVIKLRITTANQLQHRAIAACYALDVVAKPLVPSILENLDQLTPENQRFAVSWLGELGPKGEVAIPTLLRILRDKNNPARAAAVWSLPSISRDADLVIPVLIERLSDSDARVRTAAAIMLRQRFGPRAKRAVPALLKNLQDSDPYAVTQTAFALKEIDPEAAAKAGIK